MEYMDRASGKSFTVGGLYFLREDFYLRFHRYVPTFLQWLSVERTVPIDTVGRISA